MTTLFLWVLAGARTPPSRKLSEILLLNIGHCLSMLFVIILLITIETLVFQIYLMLTFSDNEYSWHSISDQYMYSITLQLLRKYINVDRYIISISDDIKTQCCYRIDLHPIMVLHFSHYFLAGVYRWFQLLIITFSVV